MINLNEIAFIDDDGFDFNTGESLIRFDVVAYYPDTKQINLLFNYPSYIPKTKPQMSFSFFCLICNNHINRIFSLFFLYLE